MARPARPEFDIGELTGVATSFALRHDVHEGYPFVSALHKGYRQHRTLDPVRIARAAGIDMMGFGTAMPWIQDESDAFLKELTMVGFELFQLAQKGDVESIRTRSLVKYIFDPELQQTI